MMAANTTERHVKVNEALIIGGTGQIGIATATALLQNGWRVKLASRTPPHSTGSFQHLRIDREEPTSIRNALGSGCDLLVDCIAFDEGHADQLLEVSSNVGQIVAISSISVYCDELGRNLVTAFDRGCPTFDLPLTEAHRTVEPGPSTYSTRKIAMERRLLEGANGNATVLRPGAIHGPYSKKPRELWFVKRLLDGRTSIPVAYKGQSKFQTTSTSAIASGIIYSWESKTQSVINVVDGNSPSVQEIGQCIMDLLAIPADLVLLENESFPPKYGLTPWSVPEPFVCSSIAPPAKSYQDTIEETLGWLLRTAALGTVQSTFPDLIKLNPSFFDYQIDDDAIKRKNMD